MVKVCCQLIIYGQRCKEDLPGAIREISRAGYDGIEAGDLRAQISAEALRSLLARYGVELAGLHVGFDGLLDVEQLCAYLKKLGAHCLMCSGVGDTSRGLAAYEEAARKLNEVGQACKSRGITLCYHNHSWEFQDLGGRTGLDVLYGNTDLRFVRACVDTYWVKHGGRDPAAFLTQWLDRVSFVHLKDMKDGTFAEVGQGILDWKAILSVLDRAGLEWYCVEQDTTTRTPEESIRLSRDYLRDSFGI